MAVDGRAHSFYDRFGELVLPTFPAQTLCYRRALPEFKLWPNSTAQMTKNNNKIEWI